MKRFKVVVVGEMEYEFDTYEEVAAVIKALHVANDDDEILWYDLEIMLGYAVTE